MFEKRDYDYLTKLEYKFKDYYTSFSIYNNKTIVYIFIKDKEFLSQNKLNSKSIKFQIDDNKKEKIMLAFDLNKDSEDIMISLIQSLFKKSLDYVDSKNRKIIFDDGKLIKI